MLERKSQFCMMVSLSLIFTLIYALVNKSNYFELFIYSFSFLASLSIEALYAIFDADFRIIPEIESLLIFGFILENFNEKIHYVLIFMCSYFIVRAFFEFNKNNMNKRVALESIIFIFISLIVYSITTLLAELAFTKTSSLLEIGFATVLVFMAIILYVSKELSNKSKEIKEIEC